MRALARQRWAGDACGEGEKISAVRRRADLWLSVLAQCCFASPHLVRTPPHSRPSRSLAMIGACTHAIESVVVRTCRAYVAAQKCRRSLLSTRSSINEPPPTSLPPFRNRRHRRCPAAAAAACASFFHWRFRRRDSCNRMATKSHSPTPSPGGRAFWLSGSIPFRGSIMLLWERHRIASLCGSCGRWVNRAWVWMVSPSVVPNWRITTARKVA